MEGTYFALQEYFVFSREIQITIIVLLYLLTVVVLYQKRVNLEPGFKNYTYYLEYLFAPIYEEVIFRGLIFVYLLSFTNIYGAVITSSIIFGLWHCKNIFLIDKKQVFVQVLGTGLFYGPLFALITFVTGNIWLAVMLHYLNNLYLLVQLKNKHGN